MPAGLSQTDKRLLLWAGTLFLILAVATVVVAPPNRDQQTAVPSTYSSATGGARAAYLLLQELQYPVRRWQEPPAQLTDPNAILILAEPSIPASPTEREGLHRFVYKGGRVLFCGPSLGSYFPGVDVEKSKPAEWTSASAQLPSPFTRGAPLIAMRPVARWTAPMGQRLPLYGPPENPDVVLWRVGKGEILWWAGASPLTNTGLTRSHNLTLFLNAVSSRNVYWDEYFHGARTSLWSYVQATPVKWGMVQIGLLLAGIIFSYTRRSGPIAVPRPVSRLSPLEFVDTLSSLYQRAGAHNVAIDVPYRQLRSSLAERLRLPAETPDDLLAQAAADRLGWDRAGIASALRTATESQSKKIAGREALSMVQTIEQFTSKLENH